ncbi:MAG: hypothetical protein QXO16_07545 [Archaeoglobaceae archaeon]
MITDKSEIEKVVSLIKKEIENSELAKKIVDLDSKLVELRKSVESIVIELTYIKDELKEIRGDKRKTPEVRREESIKVQRERVPEKQIEKERTEKTVPKVFEETEEQKTKLDDKDLIICD